MANPPTVDTGRPTNPVAHMTRLARRALAGVRSPRLSHHVTADGGVRVTATMTIRRPADDLYGMWRDFEQLPTFMTHLRSVEQLDGNRSRWIANGPTGPIEWDARITEDIPGERIAWQSTGGAVQTAGAVSFVRAPRDQGTEVRIDLEYTPPGGPVGMAVAALLGEEPRQQVRDDLRRFKQVAETGEVVRSVASPDGTRVQNQLLQHAAQPR